MNTHSTEKPENLGGPQKTSSSGGKNKAGLIILTVGLAIFIAAITIVFRGGAGQSSTQTNLMNDNNNSSVPAVSGNAFNEFINKPSPDFALYDLNGRLFSPKSLLGKKAVLFFNEGLMCYPACWDQIVALAKDKRFEENNTVAISIVTDFPDDWQKAIAKMPELAVATMVFDVGANASNRFGVLTLPSSMHKGSFPGHTYIVLDEEGIVRFGLDDPNMAINNDRLIDEIKKITTNS